MITITVKIIPQDMFDKFRKLPKQAKDEVLESVAKYLIGNQYRGLKHYPKYKYVSRKQAYGRSFSSERQRRWFFAALRAGKILPGYPRRTGRLQRGWFMHKSRRGIVIENTEERAAKYTMDDKGQARLPALVGWRKVSVVAASNERGMSRQAVLAIERLIKNYGL